MERKGWNFTELEERVRALNAVRDAEAVDPAASTALSAAVLLKPRRGTPDLCRIVARDGALATDVGFKLYHPLATPRGLRAGDFVRWTGEAFVAAPDATAADLYTYRVAVRRVVDGDTLAVSVALPHYAMDETLCLRGLDCPELGTAEGRAAKRFVEALLADASGMTVTTSKADKYDRYLADVHVRRPTGEDVFLNNALLERGHAVAMGA